MKNKPDKQAALAKSWRDPEVVIAFVLVFVLGGLVAMGLNGPLKGGLLLIAGYFFGRPLAQSVFK